MAPSGTTRLAAVIGSPVRHSLSPRLHNAAFEAAGLDWTYVAFEVPAAGLRDALVGMRALGIAGLSVTTPHKDDAAALVDDLTPTAARLGAVNCIANVDGVLVGHNTDGEGFVRSLVAGAGFTPAGRRCVVLGAGGAARSLVLALADAGADEVVVVNRTVGRAERAAALAGDRGRVVAPALADSDLFDADLVVNATSVGMEGVDAHGLPCDPAVFHEGQIVVDLVYRPLVTNWIVEASAGGAWVANGVPMLAHQAAVQFEIWTGVPAPMDVMMAAVADSLG
ncbi:MAG: shikimate dehydrogenase [Acidimicrobiia bacterium]|nr:shikimate dehydrogenase [Acidimicrobiia bacterium]